MTDTTREALAAECKRLAEEYADQHKANGALRWKTLHALFAAIDRLATPEQAPSHEETVLRLAAQLTGNEPCPKCQFVKHGCRGTPEQAPAVQAGARHERDVWIDYTNWRGERGIRHIRPQELLWLSTEYHREPQWLLHAWDVEKQAKRDFALKDIHAISLTPLVATRGQAEPTEGNWIAADDYHRNVRALDVALNGEEGAAQRPSLVDVLAQVQGEVRRRGRPLLADPKGQAEDAQRHEPNEKIMALADRIDHEKLWQRAGMDRFNGLLTPDQCDRLDAGVNLRRYADLLGNGGWRIFPPRPGVSFRASTLEKAVEMASKDAARASDARKGEAS